MNLKKLVNKYVAKNLYARFLAPFIIFFAIYIN